MKGKISLKDFIVEVKNELLAAVDDENPILAPKEVELEVAFGLDASAKAGSKLFVIELGGETKANQLHRVKLVLTPIPDSALTKTSSKLSK